MFLRFAYAYLAPFLMSMLAFVALYRWKFFKNPVYIYPLTQTFMLSGLAKKTKHRYVFYCLRLAIIISLALLVMRPQWVDERSKINVEGIDIILAIDTSESMLVFDDLHDKQSRITVAKNEAIRFIEKRTNDPIGIVLFGNEALSYCPLTLDKYMLKEMVGNLEIGIINPQGTWLGTGLATAVNRLRNTLSKNKIIILLTDGQPTQGEKIDPLLATELAQKFGVKIYTVGIGNEAGGYIAHPLLGMQRVAHSLNIALLKTIAEKTGGKFFQAKNPSDMRVIYDTIDRLEKTKYETNIFSRYYEAFIYFLWFVLGLFFIELIVRLFVWRGV